MAVIGVVAMGEMGAGIARRLHERGAEVLSVLAGRGAASIERARQAGARDVDDAGLVAHADIILSVVPPSTAGELAARLLPLIEAKSGEKPSYIDCNAIAPQTLHTIAGPFIERGLPFIDASIIGAPPRAEDDSPRLYMSGPIVGEAETLKALGLDTRVISEALGDASTLKMAYAGITKGFQALGTAMALGAARNGAAASFLAELSTSQPQLHAWLRRQLPGMYAKAYRWDGEMREIARFLEPEDGASRMLAGAAELYRHVAEDHRQGPDSEIISVLNAFVGRTE